LKGEHLHEAFIAWENDSISCILELKGVNEVLSVKDVAVLVGGEGTLPIEVKVVSSQERRQT
jgi:hypothetical protein